MMATIPVAIREVDEDPLADSQDVPMELHSDSSDVSSPDMTPETTKELWAAEGIEVLGPSAAEMAAAASSLAMRSLTDKERSSSVAPTGDVDDEKVLFEGYLRKRYSSSYYMGSWRYCVAHGNRLRWYMNEELARKDQQLRGEIFIKGVEPWNGHGSVNVYPHAFAVRTTSNRVMLCSAKSSSDKERWVQHLTRCVVSERQRRLSRRIVRNHHDGLTLPHGPEAAERRRIVPEDAVRALAVSEVTSSYGNSMNESFNMDGRTTPTATTRQQASASVVSRSSDSDRKSISGNTSVECTRCAVRFGTFVARRVVCGSCHMSFCSRHCNKYVRLSTTQSVHKCCMRCARRQEFLTYLSSVSTFVTSLSKSLAAEGKCMMSLIQRPLASEDPSQLAQEELVYARTVTKLRTAPMSLIKTIKILYQTRQKPHLFCVACERLPFYVENCIDRVESLWYQILHLFQCCDTEFSTFSMQLFCLQRYIAAICRRSPRIALQTIWHVQASMEDSSRHHPNSLLLLLGFLYPPTSSEHNVWTELLLVNTPEHQRVAIVEKLVAIHEVGRSVQTHDPDSMEERWLSATRVSEFQACAGELARSGVQVIDFQSNIQYDSLGVSGAEDEENSHLEDVVADQVRFVQSLAAISERLRHVQPVEDRSKHLGTELEELNANLISSALYPLCVASDELYKVLRVPPTEGKVFSTKMRAPTLIFIEAVPVDAANLVGAERLLPFTSARHRGSLTFIESISAMVDETTQPRDSLDSSAESDSTTHGTTPHHRRHGSQLSLPDCLDSTTDDEVSTPSSTGCVQNRQQQTKSLGGMLTNMSFPRDNRSTSTHSMPTGGFSIGALANPTTPRITHARMDNIVYDSKVYGESWDERRERIRKESPHGHLPGWQLFSIIVKTNDDLRQEMFTMQMMTKLKSIFEFEQLSLWLRTYRIVATGANIGLLETINDACSLDHLKKTFKGGNNLYEYFRATYGEPNSASFEVARRNFIQSMAAYSIVSYVLLVKDRHNGNILLGAEGHIIHIDFGFILGIAPGGMFSIEDAPFKLTEEMVMIMGGLSSPGYDLYRKLMCDGFLALQKYQSEISALLQTTGQHSPFPCFEGAKLARVVSDLRGRLCVGLTKLQIEKRVDHLISKSYNAWGTRKYDSFQLRSNNIHP